MDPFPASFPSCFQKKTQANKELLIQPRFVLSLVPAFKSCKVLARGCHKRPCGVFFSSEILKENVTLIFIALVVRGQNGEKDL